MPQPNWKKYMDHLNLIKDPSSNGGIKKEFDRFQELERNSGEYHKIGDGCCNKLNISDIEIMEKHLESDSEESSLLKEMKVEIVTNFTHNMINGEAS